MSRQSRRLIAALQYAIVGVVAVVTVGAAAFVAWRHFVPVADPPLRYPDVTAAILARVDFDKSGFVDGEEYGKVGLEDVPFDHFDLNADGRLSPYEVEKSFLEESPSAMLEAHDAGHRAPPTGGMQAQPGTGLGPNNPAGRLPPPTP